MSEPLTEAAEAAVELGSVDWAVVEFPGSRFRGEIPRALEELVERDPDERLRVTLARQW